jgi:hypothetical protein
MPQIIGPNYQVIAGDWQQLESIINDLTQRFITQSMSITSSPTFIGLTLTGLTASKVVFTNASKGLTSTGIGTPSQFIKGDGSLDSTVYASAANYVPYTGATTNVNLGAHSITCNNITDSGLTITRIPYSSTGGLLIDSSNLAFDGTNLTCSGYGKFLSGITLDSTAPNLGTSGFFRGVISSPNTNTTMAFFSASLTRNALGGVGVSSAFKFENIWSPTIGATANRTTTSLTGASSRMSIITDTSEIRNMTVTNGIIYDTILSTTDGSGSSGIPKFTTLYHYRATSPTLSTLGRIGTCYAFYDAGQTVGTQVTNPWGFYGLTANNYLSALQIGGTATIGMGAGTLSCSGLITATAGILSNSDIKLNTVGNGYYVKEGTNATMGVVTLVLGVATVNTTKVTANSRIFLTTQGGTLTNIANHYISARIAGTSFTITSMNLLDTSDVGWIIIEPA